MSKQRIGKFADVMKTLKWIYRILNTVLGVFGICIRCDPHVNDLYAAAAFVLYLVILEKLQKIYQACEIEKLPAAELILSQTLSNLFADGIFTLCISFWLHCRVQMIYMLITFIIQEVISVLWTCITKKVYCSHCIPLRTEVIYQEEAEYKKLCQSPFFDLQHLICRYRRYQAGESLSSVWNGDCDAVFLVGLPEEVVNEITKKCAGTGKNVYVFPRLGQIIISGAEYDASFSLPIWKISPVMEKRNYHMGKRMMDIIGAAAGLLLLFPVMSAVALAIYMEDGGPVFYRQIRLTKGGREFRMWKFRSMCVNAESDGIARLAEVCDQRITKVGRMIRACRLDELPQLINILLGHMSIVGPRPERPEIALQYENQIPEFKLRLQVKAGLTGMAQIYGKYNTEPYQKLQMDLLYINRMSLATDFKLILATVKVLFLKERAMGVCRNMLL